MILLDEFEKRLNYKVQNVFKELNVEFEMPENADKIEEEKKNEGNCNLEIFQEKTIDVYDREITQAVKNLHPEIFETKIIFEEETKENPEILE